MSAKVQYDQDLRAIGQALEAEGISVFEMKRDPSRYVISGAPEQPTRLLQALRQLKTRLRESGPRTLTFGQQELSRLHWRGCSARKAADALPDFYDLSSTLRTVGAYLDAQKAELLGLQKRRLSLTLLYHNGDGYPRVEDRTIASFYDLFVQQYGRRSRRPSNHKSNR